MKNLARTTVKTQVDNEFPGLLELDDCSKSSNRFSQIELNRKNSFYIFFKLW